jgi:hypothetical protein
VAATVLFGNFDLAVLAHRLAQAGTSDGKPERATVFQTDPSRGFPARRSKHTPCALAPRAEPPRLSHAVSGGATRPWWKP